MSILTEHTTGADRGALPLEHPGRKLSFLHLRSYFALEWLLAVGETVDAKIVAVDRAALRLSLTVKGKGVEEEREAMKEFGWVDSGASLGNVLGACIRRQWEMAGKE